MITHFEAVIRKGRIFGSQQSRLLIPIPKDKETKIIEGKLLTVIVQMNERD